MEKKSQKITRPKEIEKERPKRIGRYTLQKKKENTKKKKIKKIKRNPGQRGSEDGLERGPPKESERIIGKSKSARSNKVE